MLAWDNFFGEFCNTHYALYTLLTDGVLLFEPHYTIRAAARYRIDSLRIIRRMADNQFRPMMAFWSSAGSLPISESTVKANSAASLVPFSL